MDPHFDNQFVNSRIESSAVSDYAERGDSGYEQ